MRYQMRQRLWNLAGDDFRIKDEAGADRFYVDGRAFTIGDKLSIHDTAGTEVAFVRQRLLSWGKTYEIERAGRLAAVVKQKRFTLARYRFTVDDAATPDPVDLTIEGSFLDHEYTFARGGRPVAAVSKRWFSWSDSYGVDVADGEDDVLILACTVVVDQATDKDGGGGGVSGAVAGGLSSVVSAALKR